MDYKYKNIKELKSAIEENKSQIDEVLCDASPELIASLLKEEPSVLLGWVSNLAGGAVFRVLAAQASLLENDEFMKRLLIANPEVLGNVFSVEDWINKVLGNVCFEEDWIKNWIARYHAKVGPLVKKHAEQFLSQKEFVLKILSQKEYCHLLPFVSTDLRNDKEVVNMAIMAALGGENHSLSPTLFKNGVSGELKKNKRFLLPILSIIWESDSYRSNTELFQYIDIDLQSDPDFVLLLFTLRPRGIHEQNEKVKKEVLRLLTEKSAEELKETCKTWTTVWDFTDSLALVPPDQQLAIFKKLQEPIQKTFEKDKSVSDFISLLDESKITTHKYDIFMALYSSFLTKDNLSITNAIKLLSDLNKTQQADIFNIIFGFIPAGAYKDSDEFIKLLSLCPKGKAYAVCDKLLISAAFEPGYTAYGRDHYAFDSIEPIKKILRFLSGDEPFNLCKKLLSDLALLKKYSGEVFVKILNIFQEETRIELLKALSTTLTALSNGYSSEYTFAAILNSFTISENKLAVLKHFATLEKVEWLQSYETIKKILGVFSSGDERYKAFSILLKHIEALVTKNGFAKFREFWESTLYSSYTQNTGTLATEKMSVEMFMALIPAFAPWKKDDIIKLALLLPEQDTKEKIILEALEKNLLERKDAYNELLAYRCVKEIYDSIEKYIQKERLQEEEMPTHLKKIKNPLSTFLGHRFYTRNEDLPEKYKKLQEKNPLAAMLTFLYDTMPQDLAPAVLSFLGIGRSETTSQLYKNIFPKILMGLYYLTPETLANTIATSKELHKNIPFLVTLCEKNIFPLEKFSKQENYQQLCEAIMERYDEAEPSSKEYMALVKNACDILKKTYLISSNTYILYPSKTQLVMKALEKMEEKVKQGKRIMIVDKDTGDKMEKRKDAMYKL